VRAFLHSKGHATFDAPPSAEGDPDNGDFYLGALPPEGDRIEVKHRIGRNTPIPFTDRDSFPYEDVLVCEQHQFDDKDPAPFMFFNVNAQMTWAYVNPAAQSEQWELRKRYDKFKRRYGWFYYAPLSVTKFINIEAPERYEVELDYPASAWDTEGVAT
jgi:hypothetical protein